MYKEFYICGLCFTEFCMCGTSFISSTTLKYIEGHWTLPCSKDALYQVCTDRLHVTG